MGGAFDLGVRAAASLLPVIVFLIGLILIDSYKLVSPRAVLWSLVAGCLAAALSFVLNSQTLLLLDVDMRTFSRYIAPLLEEAVKAAFLIYLIRSHRVGFLVDAAIHGFAIGAGFSLIENLYYLYLLPDASLPTAIVRGFGTAIMHGGATALLGIVAKTMFDRYERSGALVVLAPGLAIAYALHSLFNHFLLSPLASTGLLILVFPPLVMFVFQRSEEATRSWLGAGFDSDQELLRLLASEELASTRVGQYLYALKTRFPGEVVVDMLCLLRIRAELSVRAKGILMMRNAGFPAPADPSLGAKFNELSYLEKSIGPTGLMALDPFFHTTSRDLWNQNMLTAR